MTPQEFIAKWHASTRNERAACQEHFIDLCQMLGESTPGSDPTGETYAFEKGATKFTGDGGWADVWKAGHFAWEYKKKRGDLNAAHRQLLLYAGPLGNPPLLIVSDIERIVIRTNWTNAVTETHEVLLNELGDPLRLRLLKWAFSDPEQLRPSRTRQKLTEDAATQFAELARRLRDRGHDPQVVAHFVNRLVFCFFADDVGLLPKGLFDQMLAISLRRPGRSAKYASLLFGAMAKSGGEVGFVEVPWFNGGLFENDSALPLEKDDIERLIDVSKLGWAEIDPSVLGTLFERGLDPDKRSQLGAHYTDRAKIEMLIDPVIRRPLLAEWTSVRAKIEATLALPPPRGRRASAGKSIAQELYHGYLQRLRHFRVLDPACGSGNFLYLSLQALKDLEHQASVEAETLGLQREFPQVGPETMLGIEINEYAVELARVSVWIGHIQWTRRHGYAAPSNPVLDVLNTIERRDAVLAPDGSIAKWPSADVIVGNPPFLGDKEMIGSIGEEYTERLRLAYRSRIPNAVNLVCYWFSNAWEAVATGSATRAGLVATQSIRRGSNRRVLEPIAEIGGIFDAWSNEPWTVDGADVRVSVICFAATNAEAATLNGRGVPTIYSDLSSNGVDVTTATRVSENRGVCFQGPVKVGPFDIDGEIARRWLQESLNTNGRPNSDVVRPWVNGQDLTDRPSDTWIIDFNARSESDAAYYAGPFAHVLKEVRPRRENNRDRQRRESWWLLGRSGGHYRQAISELPRYIATPRVSKHRVFVWLHSSTIPDTRVVIVAHDSDAVWGILQSRFHTIWALAHASRHGVGNDPTYNSQTCFETFPFPEHLTPDLPAASYADNPHAQAIAAAARELVEKRDLWLNPPDLTERVAEVVPGYPDRIVPRDTNAAAFLKTRTLTNLYNARGTPEGAWLDNLHRTLDAAVAAAYGWPADLSDDEVLARLLALNQARQHKA